MDGLRLDLDALRREFDGRRVEFTPIFSDIVGLRLELPPFCSVID
jgi:hypothetical protein